MRVALFRGWLLLVPLVAFSCQSDEAASNDGTSAAVDLKAALPGAWQTVRVNVAINTADGRDTFEMAEITEGIWSRQFGMHPPVYYFQPDQKYRWEHRTLNDSLFSRDRGIWNVFGDTLMLITENATYEYRVRLGEGIATFRGFVDWDGDGEEDDEYQAVQRLISLEAGE